VSQREALQLHLPPDIIYIINITRPLHNTNTHTSTFLNLPQPTIYTAMASPAAYEDTKVTNKKILFRFCSEW
jgi:hypothetical protein